MTNAQDYNQSNQPNDDDQLIDQITGKPLNSEVLPASELPNEKAYEGNPGASSPLEVVDYNSAPQGTFSELSDDDEANLDPINNNNSDQVV